MKLMVGAGFDVNALSGNEASALSYVCAINSDKMEIIKYMINAKADVNAGFFKKNYFYCLFLFI